MWTREYKTTIYAIEYNTTIYTILSLPVHISYVWCYAMYQVIIELVKIVFKIDSYLHCKTWGVVTLILQYFSSNN